MIFDCDCVLVDSEVISCAHPETLTDHGHPITPDQALDRFLGMSDREARLGIEAELGRKLPDDFEALMRPAALELRARAATHLPCRRDRPAEMRRSERYARENSTRPERCLVIEDSLPRTTARAPGMMAAAAAGPAAHLTFDDMRQLPLLLGQIEAEIAAN